MACSTALSLFSTRLLSLTMVWPFAYVLGSCFMLCVPGAESDFVGDVGGASGYQDGTGTNALFSSPGGICIGSDEVIYLADFGNYRIRTITTTGIRAAWISSIVVALILHFRLGRYACWWVSRACRWSLDECYNALSLWYYH